MASSREALHMTRPASQAIRAEALASHVAGRLVRWSAANLPRCSARSVDNRPL